MLDATEGSYKAVVTDYGVHILFLARKYGSDTSTTTAETYSKDSINVDGTFSKFFYNATVNAVIGTFNSGIRGEYMKRLSTNTTVKLYKDRYKDLYRQ